jgi:hypothetical protein
LIKFNEKEMKNEGKEDAANTTTETDLKKENPNPT